MTLRPRYFSQPNLLRSCHSQLGLTLLEVLIALLVLSIGLVGAAVLTVQSLQSTHSSLHTSLASAAALDFEERLWVDLGRISAGCPAVNTVAVDFASDWAATPERFGLPRFNSSVENLGITATVISDSATPNFQRIRLNLTWREDRFDTGTESFSYEIGILCRPAS